MLAGGAALALYFGARAAQDRFGADRLPPVDEQAASSFRRTSFLVTSAGADRQLTGTVTVDTETLAFEYFGRPGTDQQGIRIVSPDGRRTFVDDGGAWRPADDDVTAGAIRRVLPYLVGIASADDVIGGVTREQYLELVDRTTEGSGDDELTRYEMVLDGARYQSGSPREWEEFGASVVPDVPPAADVDMVMATDRSNVVVRLDVPVAGWKWERLAYSSDQFVPFDPVPPTAPSG